MKFTRHQFLGLSAGALVTGAFCRGAEPAASAGALSLGYSLYGMKKWPLDESIRQCARIGYRNIELCSDPGFPAEPAKLSRGARQELRKQVENAGLWISGLMLNLNLADPALHAANLSAIRTAAELAHDLAPTSPPPIETVTRGKRAEWLSLKEGILDRLREWGDAATKDRVKIVLKAHYSMAVSTPDQLAMLLREANRPSLRAAFDYSHFELQEIPLEKSWHTLAPYADFVHVKDTAGNAQKAQMLLPGDGRTDYVAMFRMLRATGYQGAVVVEVSSQLFNKPDYNPIQAAEKSYAVLSRALIAAH